MLNIVQSVYKNAQSHDFLVQVGLHHGSLLLSPLFIIKLEALSRKIRSGCSEELVYADDLALISPFTLKSLKEKLEA